MEREALLRDLIELRVAPEAALDQLRRFPWDSEELVAMTRSDAVRVIDAYLDGRLSESECEAWADALEMRDDVGLEAGFEDDLRDFVFDLANPVLEGPLTRASALAWRSRMGPVVG